MAINGFLIDRYSQRKRVLLIIDEGQNLSEEALEEVRMLSNLQSDDQSLLQIMLVGQPELIAKLKQPSMRQFSQRIAASYHLTGLDRQETGNYIAHRLRMVGGDPDLFTPAAVDIIYKLSGGIPRAINLVCQAALVYGFAESAAEDRPGHHQAASTRTTSASGWPPRRRRQPAAGLLPPPRREPQRQRLRPQARGARSRHQRPEADGDRTSSRTWRSNPRALREDQFQQLVALLKQERQQNEELLRKVERLEFENKHLKRVGLLMRQKLQGTVSARPEIKKARRVSAGALSKAKVRGVRVFGVRC